MIILCLMYSALANVADVAWIGAVNFMSEKKSKAQVFAARLFSTLILWAGVTLIFMSGSPWAFAALMVVLGCAASWEYFSMAKKTDYPVQFRLGVGVSFAYLISIGYLLAKNGEEALPTIGVMDGGVISLVVMSAFILQLRNPLEQDRSLNAVATTSVGFIYIAFFFGFMARLMFVSDGTNDVGVPGAWLIIWLIAVTKFTDMGAYITGSLIGKNKMIPHISPGKTWEGFFGALGWAQLAG